MPVSTQHPDYIKNLPLWTATRDASAGDAAIKAARETYLPNPDKNDPDRYEAYLTRAVFMGVTGRTRAALSGMVFRKDGTRELPTRLDSLAENIDGGGQSLEQIAKEGLEGILEAGRHIFFVDYPNAREGLTAEEEASLALRPILISYPAESLINWKTESINSVSTLTMAVICEYVNDETADEYSHSTVEQYLVLRLVDGVYMMARYKKDGTLIGDIAKPRMAGGAAFDHIPLYISEAMNNKPGCDMPPLYDIAKVNISHYQVMADHKENLFIHGQLTLGITSDLGADEWKKTNPNGVVVGARKGYYLGTQGAFHTVTAPESSSLRVALQDHEAQMVALGARLVQRGGQVETAEAARINASAEASTLDTVVDNLSEAMEAALEDMALFLGESPDAVQFQLNKDFWEASLNPAALAAAMGLLDGQVVAKSDVRQMIRTGRIGLDSARTDEDIDEENAGDMLNSPPPPVVNPGSAVPS